MRDQDSSPSGPAVPWRLKECDIAVVSYNESCESKFRSM